MFERIRLWWAKLFCNEYTITLFTRDKHVEAMDCMMRDLDFWGSEKALVATSTIIVNTKTQPSDWYYRRMARKLLKKEEVVCVLLGGNFYLKDDKILMLTNGNKFMAIPEDSKIIMED